VHHTASPRAARPAGMRGALDTSPFRARQRTSQHIGTSLASMPDVDAVSFWQACFRWRVLGPSRSHRTAATDMLERSPCLLRPALAVRAACMAALEHRHGGSMRRTPLTRCCVVPLAHTQAEREGRRHVQQGSLYRLPTWRCLTPVPEPIPFPPFALPTSDARS